MNDEIFAVATKADMEIEELEYPMYNDILEATKKNFLKDFKGGYEEYVKSKGTIEERARKIYHCALDKRNDRITQLYDNIKTMIRKDMEYPLNNDEAFNILWKQAHMIGFQYGLNCVVKWFDDYQKMAMKLFATIDKKA